MRPYQRRTADGKHRADIPKRLADPIQALAKKAGLHFNQMVVELLTEVLKTPKGATDDIKSGKRSGL